MSTTTAEPDGGTRHRRHESHFALPLAVIVLMLVTDILVAFGVLYQMRIRRRIRKQFPGFRLTKVHCETRKEVMRFGFVLVSATKLALSLMWALDFAVHSDAFEKTFILCVWIGFAVVRIVTVLLSAKFASIVVAMHTKLNLHFNAYRTNSSNSITQAAYDSLRNCEWSSVISFVALIAVFFLIFGLIVAVSVSPEAYNVFAVCVSLCELYIVVMLQQSTRFVTRKTDKSTKQIKKSAAVSKMEFDRQLQTLLTMKTMLVLIVVLLIYPNCSIISAVLRMTGHRLGHEKQRLPFSFWWDVLCWNVHICCVELLILTYTWIDYSQVLHSHQRATAAPLEIKTTPATSSALEMIHTQTAATGNHVLENEDDEDDTSSSQSVSAPKLEKYPSSSSDRGTGHRRMSSPDFAQQSASIRTTKRRNTTTALFERKKLPSSEFSSPRRKRTGSVQSQSGSCIRYGYPMRDGFGVIPRATSLLTMDIANLMKTGYTVEKLFSEVTKIAGASTPTSDRLMQEMHRETYESEFSTSRRQTAEDLQSTGMLRFRAAADSATEESSMSLEPATARRVKEMETKKLFELPKDSSQPQSMWSATSGKGTAKAKGGTITKPHRIGVKQKQLRASPSPAPLRVVAMKVLKEDQPMTPIFLDTATEMPDIDEVIRMQTVPESKDSDEVATANGSRDDEDKEEKTTATITGTEAKHTMEGEFNDLLSVDVCYATGGKGTRSPSPCTTSPSPSGGMYLQRGGASMSIEESESYLHMPTPKFGPHTSEIIGGSFLESTLGVAMQRMPFESSASIFGMSGDETDLTDFESLQLDDSDAEET